MQDQTVIFLMGPTCSGKTARAMAAYDKGGVALISVDSAQIYRGLNIGAAKPDAATLEAYPHALIDICEPEDTYSVSDFCLDAKVAIEAAFAAGKTPLLVGGTMMYFKALKDGLSPLPATDPAVRQQLLLEAEVKSWPAMHAKLSAVDPVTAQRLQPTDAQRIGRALEVYEMTGKPLSSFHETPGTGLAYPIEAHGLIPEDRASLHQSIANRFDEMLALGFLEEVEGLIKRPGLTPNLPAMRSVGYRQAWAYLSGEIKTFEDFREQAIAATRQLAKRQITWLRSWPGLQPASNVV